MRKFSFVLIVIYALFSFSTYLCAAEKCQYEAFTARVKNNKVRLRLEPHTNSHIIREVNRGELFIVADEVDDFYAVFPPEWIKAYVYRTFVIDNVIEGTKVNVRSAPTLEAPIIAQLNTGDRVEGTISSQNNRWLKIKTPESARFYISKVLLERIGPAEYMETMKRRQQEVDFLMTSAQKMAQEELEKEFEDIQLDEAYGYLDKIVQDYSEFSNQALQAKKLTQEFQQAYLQKKIHFLEMKAQKIADSFHTQSPHIDEEIRIHQQQLTEVEREIEQNKMAEESQNADEESATQPSAAVTAKMAFWHPYEEKFFHQWIAGKNDDTLTHEDFYQEETTQALILPGVIEAYTKEIKNKPGDYILLNKSNRLPIAYLYSTRVNLQDYIGKEVMVRLIKRPHNNFAFPAYYVLEIE